MNKIRTFIETARAGGLCPPTFVTEGLSSEPEVVMQGRRLVSFASANYLGLNNDPRVKQAAVEGIERYGLHPGASRSVSGTLDVHCELERRTAEMMGTEDAMLFQTGMLANMGAIPAIVDMPLRAVSATLRRGLDRRRNVIFSDEFNHASIVDASLLAKSEVVTYRHNDIGDLAQKMEDYEGWRALIVTDGVFSMNGDVARMPDLVGLARKHGAVLMVDDAHGVGVLGRSGRGALDHFGLSGGVHVNMGSFAKAFGVVGGFIAGERDLIEYLRVAARTYMFSGATLGAVALAALKSIEIAQKEPERRLRLWAATRRLRDALNAQGNDVLGLGETPIVPVLIGDEVKAAGLSQDLFAAGYFAPCITYPAVPKKRARIRLTVSSLHTDRQLDDIAAAMGEICRRRGVRLAA